ncbi:MAG: ATP-binding protein [Aquisalimonadaceae bacterium]
MQETAIEIAERYRGLLADYKGVSAESALHAAYKLGREALSQNLSLLELATLHHEALSDLLAHGAEGPDLARRATLIFNEALSCYEMAHHNANDANIALRRINEAQEHALRRFAHAVHDQSGQLMTTAHLRLNAVAEEATPEIAEKIRSVIKLLHDVEREFRELSHDLRPTVLDDLGLAPALEQLAEKAGKRSGLEILVDADSRERLSGELETALYRIAQEALQNVIRHADARTVSIRLMADDGRNCLVYTIRDDGQGFDVRRRESQRGGDGLGLVGVRERLNAFGGHLNILSVSGEGTCLKMEIPLPR